MSARPFARSATTAANAHSSSARPDTIKTIRGPLSGSAIFVQSSITGTFVSHSPVKSAASGDVPGKKRNGSPKMNCRNAK